MILAPPRVAVQTWARLGLTRISLIEGGPPIESPGRMSDLMSLGTMYEIDLWLVDSTANRPGRAGLATAALPPYSWEFVPAQTVPVRTNAVLRFVLGPDARLFTADPKTLYGADLSGDPLTGKVSRLRRLETTIDICRVPFRTQVPPIGSPIRMTALLGRVQEQRKVPPAPNPRDFKGGSDLPGTPSTVAVDHLRSGFSATHAESGMAVSVQSKAYVPAFDPPAVLEEAIRATPPPVPARPGELAEVLPGRWAYHLSWSGAHPRLAVAVGPAVDITVMNARLAAREEITPSLIVRVCNADEPILDQGRIRSTSWDRLKSDQYKFKPRSLLERVSTINQNDIDAALDALDIAISLVPGLDIFLDAGDLTLALGPGTDKFGRPLSTADRFIVGMAVLLPGVGAPVLRKLGKVLGHWTREVSAATVELINQVASRPPVARQMLRRGVEGHDELRGLGTSTISKANKDEVIDGAIDAARRGDQLSLLTDLGALTRGVPGPMGELISRADLLEDSVVSDAWAAHCRSKLGNDPRTRQHPIEWLLIQKADSKVAQAMARTAGPGWKHVVRAQLADPALKQLIRTRHLLTSPTTFQRFFDVIGEEPALQLVVEDYQAIRKRVDGDRYPLDADHIWDKRLLPGDTRKVGNYTPDTLPAVLVIRSQQHATVFAEYAASVGRTIMGYTHEARTALVQQLIPNGVEKHVDFTNRDELQWIYDCLVTMHSDLSTGDLRATILHELGNVAEEFARAAGKQLNLRADGTVPVRLRRQVQGDKGLTMQDTIVQMRNVVPPATPPVIPATLLQRLPRSLQDKVRAQSFPLLRSVPLQKVRN